MEDSYFFGDSCFCKSRATRKHSSCKRGPMFGFARGRRPRAKRAQSYNLGPSGRTWKTFVSLEILPLASRDPHANNRHASEGQGLALRAAEGRTQSHSLGPSGRTWKTIVSMEIFPFASRAVHATMKWIIRRFCYMVLHQKISRYTAAQHTAHHRPTLYRSGQHTPQHRPNMWHEMTHHTSRYAASRHNTLTRDGYVCCPTLEKSAQRVQTLACGGKADSARPSLANINLK